MAIGWNKNSKQFPRNVILLNTYQSTIMHKELIIAAYEKARKELQNRGAQDPSNHQKSIVIANYITDETNFAISKKSISNFYKSSLELPELEDINISQQKVVQGLCDYLGFANYHAFVNHKNLAKAEKNEADFKTEPEVRIIKGKSDRKKMIWLLIIGVVVIFTGLYFTMSINEQRWMLWNIDHYEEVEFDRTKLTNGTLKIWKEERIENFKKINEPGCSYQFFNEDGSVNAWYGKNKKGVLEVFTDIGLHPDTGKSLKPITNYIIKKYICESY